MTTEIVNITVEPDWNLTYVEGELYTEGHDYDKAKDIIGAVNRADDSCEIITHYFNPDGWRGSEQELDELIDTYALHSLEERLEDS